MGPFFSSASVVNNSNQNLPTSPASCASSQYALGCAYLQPTAGTFQNGTPYSSNGLFILPPPVSSNFTKVIFTQPSPKALVSGSGWQLAGNYGISYSAVNLSQGVSVTIVAIGTAPGSSSQTWAVLDNFNVTQSSNVSRATPLGDWPLYTGFKVAIQVATLGTNNWSDSLVVDGLSMEPVQIAFPALFNTASVYNSSYSSLPKTQPACASSHYAVGCAYLTASGTYQNGAPFGANSLLLLPPPNSSDNTTIYTPSITTLATSAPWQLVGTYGIAYAPNNGAQGVSVTIIAMGTPPGATASVAVAIDSFDVSKNSNVIRATPLGDWPALKNFQIAVRVTTLGTSNSWDNLVVDGLGINSGPLSPALVKTPVKLSASPSTLPLNSFFSSAAVVNNVSANLANTSSLCNSSQWSSGCAYLSSEGSYQTGQSFPANSILVLPPASSSNFTKVIFNQPSSAALAASYQWSLSGSYGIEYAPNNLSGGVQVQVVVSGDPIDSSDAPWAVIDSFTVAQGAVVNRSSALGTWPLRNNFQLALQVSARGATNAYDNLLISQLSLTPTVPRPTLGIAQSNLSSDPNALGVISGVAAMGSASIRAAMANSFTAPTFVNSVLAANQAGMRVIAVIFPEGDDYDNAAESTAYAGNATFTATCGYNSGALKLSQIDVWLFTQRFTRHLEALQAAGAQVDAFEIGNELDWGCFNGDIPIGQAGTTASSLTTFSSKYALLLQAARSVVDVYYPNSALLSFGAANCYLFNDSFCVQDPQNLLAGLQNISGTNYLELVDGFGEHLYPPSISDTSATLTALQRMSAALGNSKPYWVTEWGFNSANLSSQARYSAFRQFLELMNSSGAIAVSHLQLYDYSSNDGYGLLSGGTSGSLNPEARVFSQYNPRLIK
jgi:hypothetical protein